MFALEPSPIIFAVIERVPSILGYLLTTAVTLYPRDRAP